ncbi:golgi integral membrane protein [Anaeramoeba flamelloides]|uniref:Golgi integral membrane protein n=1 Tax=Anaeramoeba flamelloides TaxID=1746091 RepID=A0ABQ8YZ58_9EUKA|nr:golgi integral membrane protein [Anaeramoeba flamelloides]
MLNLIQTTALKEEKKSVLLNNFRQQTGSSLTDALSYLDVCNWDYQFSVGVFGLLGLKNASRSKTNFTKLNDSLVEMNEFFAPQSSEGEETMNFTQRKRTVETIYEEKNSSPKERKIMIRSKTKNQEQNSKKNEIQPKKDEQDEQEEEEEEILSKISEEEHLRKLDKLENILSHGFLNWDKRLRAIIEFDPELIIGYPHHLKTKNQITIKKKIFELLSKYSSKKVSKKNLQRGVHSFLAKFGFRNDTKHNHNVMIFRSKK